MRWKFTSKWTEATCNDGVTTTGLDHSRVHFVFPDLALEAVDNRVEIPQRNQLELESTMMFKFVIQT